MEIQPQKNQLAPLPAELPFSAELSGQKIRLLRPGPEWTDRVWSYLQRDRERGGRNYSWIESSVDVAKYITAQPEIDTKDIDYLILKGEDVIGSVHMHSASLADHKAEVGYALEKGEEGQGFASEALQLLLAEMKRLGFNKAIINCNKTNLRSIKVAERNGFRHEGLLVQDCIENGQFRDSMIFGKLLR